MVGKLLTIFFFCAVTIESTSSADLKEKLSSHNSTLDATRLEEIITAFTREVPSIRTKRQSGGGSTAVIGARITQDATAGDWQQANLAVNNAPPSRGKRAINSGGYGSPNFGGGGGFGSPSNGVSPASVNIVLQLLVKLLEDSKRAQTFTPNVPEQSFDVGPTGPRCGTGRAYTRTQELFGYINCDIRAARRYGSMNEIQSNNVLRVSLVYDEQGVNCGEVCDIGNGVGYGLLGLCTPNYCQCDVQARRGKQEYYCREGYVFDPVTLLCQYPADTILCSDMQRPTSQYGVQGYM